MHSGKRVADDFKNNSESHVADVEVSEDYAVSHLLLWREFWRQARPHSSERSLLAYTKALTTQVDLGPLALPERIRRGHGILERPRDEFCHLSDNT
ncbi:hypothetical protein NQZ68_000857 [Dissostichus eleginoides]|nr:hypothetical protein NQZ68_000857 [Dissostichus eleginoides]